MTEQLTEGQGLTGERLVPVIATQGEVHAAAIKWCGEKDRETFSSDIAYFHHNWSSLPGLTPYVQAEIEKRPEFAQARRAIAPLLEDAGLGGAKPTGRERAEESPSLSGGAFDLETPYVPVLIRFEDPPRLEYVINDAPGFYDRIDDRLELMRAMGSREVIGVRIFLSGAACLPHSLAAEVHKPALLEDGELVRALERLGSMEAFEGSRMVDKDRDAELLARINYARQVLASRLEGLGEGGVSPGVGENVPSEKKCLTPDCIYSTRIAARYLQIGVTFPEHGPNRRQLSGLLGHLFDNGSKRGALNGIYENALHDALEPIIANILAADAAYKEVIGNIGNPEGWMRDKAFDAAVTALSTAVSPTKPAEVHDPLPNLQGESRTEPVTNDKEHWVELLFEVQTGKRSCRNMADLILKTLATPALQPVGSRREK